MTMCPRFGFVFLVFSGRHCARSCLQFIQRNTALLEWTVNTFHGQKQLLSSCKSRHMFSNCWPPDSPTTKEAIFLSANFSINLSFPQYLIYSCILGLISCSVFLRINYELKMMIMLTALVVYNIIILQTHGSLLDEYSRFLYKAESVDR